MFSKLVRVWYKKNNRTINLNMYCSVLVEMDVYKQLLEKHNCWKSTWKVMKYSAPTKRTNILFDTENIKRCILISVWVNYDVTFFCRKSALVQMGASGVPWVIVIPSLKP